MCYSFFVSLRASIQFSFFNVPFWWLINSEVWALLFLWSNIQRTYRVLYRRVTLLLSAWDEKDLLQKLPFGNVELQNILKFLFSVRFLKVSFWLCSSLGTTCEEAERPKGLKNILINIIYIFVIDQEERS